MDIYEGILKELGTRSGTKYTYIEIGDRRLKKIDVHEGINSKLRIAIQKSEAVTLYAQGGLLVGIKTSDGKTFASDANYLAHLYIGLVLLVFGIPTAFFGIGIPLVYYGIVSMRHAFALMAMRKVPDVILL